MSDQYEAPYDRNRTPVGKNFLFQKSIYHCLEEHSSKGYHMVLIAQEDPVIRARKGDNFWVERNRLTSYRGWNEILFNPEKEDRGYTFGSFNKEDEKVSRELAISLTRDSKCSRREAIEATKRKRQMREI